MLILNRRKKLLFITFEKPLIGMFFLEKYISNIQKHNAGSIKIEKRIYIYEEY